MHGTTMMFLFAVPVMEALGVYLVPLMVGTRNVAFPRLNAFGYWVYLVRRHLALYVAFFLNTGPDAGWFAYVPLSGPEFSPGKRADVWAQMITFTEIAALVVRGRDHRHRSSSMRAPGHVAQPHAALRLGDAGHRVHGHLRHAGGDARQHHAAAWTAWSARTSSTRPRAATRCCGSTCSGSSGTPRSTSSSSRHWASSRRSSPTFTRRPVFGYPAMVLSLVATGFLGFGLWVHHMFATGLPQLGESFFTAASMMIAIPSGIQIFCWIATHLGRPAALHDADAVRPRVLRRLRHRRPDRA